ncbi:AsmA family protein [Acidovorax sp. A1169]|uniref:AsmA family protein n=1 Tax=Acidovorax sp. A1169 TaxID=3059524 RepID=UPI002737F34F|nr:AsmA family protein [Acidovorax sp. A1169]MDP4074743.1 AsmA family protein [Acidovorax sp. A1169]
MPATPSTDMPNPPPPAGRLARMPLHRAVKWVLVLAGLLVGLAVLVGVVMSLMDWNRYKPLVNEKVSEAAGRRFEIEGDLSAAWRWPQPLEEGWRRWVPGVTVKAERLVMDNPAGFEPPFSGDDKNKGKDKGASTTAARAPASAASEGSASTAPPPATLPGTATMAHIGSVSASISLLPLLSRHLAIDTVALTDPEIALARTKDGSNNWTFKHKDEDDPKSPWTFDVGRLVVNQGLLAYADAQKDVDLQAQVNTTEPVDPAQAGSAKAAKASILPASAAASSAEAAASRDVVASQSSASGGTSVPYGLQFKLQGRIAKAQVEGSGRAGQVISLRDKVVNYPLQIEATAGSAALSAEGILANPGALSGMDFDVMLKAYSMADLYEVTGLVLPSTPPFETRGRLTGSLEPERAVWSYSDFRGKVGQSDLQGDLKYTSGKPRPKLMGRVTSSQLRLADLGPALGTAKASNTHRGKTDGKVLPDANFAAERWSAMDMDIAFKGEHIIRSESLPLEDLSLRAVMDNAQLRLAPLTFGVAKGKIESEVIIDGRTPPLKAQIRGKVEGLQLSALFPKVELMKKSFGRMDGAVALRSSGNNVADLLGKGTGEARLYVREGTLSKQMLDLASLNVGSIIVGKLFGDDKEVRLRCAVADFTVVDGLAQTRVVKMSTDDAVIEATGTIDLGTEAMNLRIKPESLEWKFFSLRTPLYVKGTFGNPDVGVEPGPLLLRAGAAVVAAVAAPVALALIPVTVPAADDDTYCKPLLDLAKEPVKPGAEGASGTASQPARDAASRQRPAR